MSCNLYRNLNRIVQNYRCTSRLLNFSLHIPKVETKIVPKILNRHLVYNDCMQIRNNSSISDISYEEACKETLESLTDFFEELQEIHPELSNGDISYSDGVLTINLGEKYGTYVINRQVPNKQIWLSSPTSGPKRYDYENGGWVYRHNNQSLHSLLQNELSEILNKQIDLSQCSHYKP